MHLIASTGRILGGVPQREAQRLIRKRDDGTSIAVVEDLRGSVVRSVRLVEILGEPKKAPSRPSIQDYMGQRYTHRERMKNGPVQTAGRIEFNYIDPEDAPLFRLAVTDCLVG